MANETLINWECKGNVPQRSYKNVDVQKLLVTNDMLEIRI
jgi:hypothetical protein